MTNTRKSVKLFLYPLLIALCLAISIGLLYINFNDFVMPYAVVIGLLITCAVVASASYIGYLMIPGGSTGLIARLWRTILLIVMSVVVVILVVLPVLVIENA